QGFSPFAPSSTDRRLYAIYQQGTSPFAPSAGPSFGPVYRGAPAGQQRLFLSAPVRKYDDVSADPTSPWPPPWKGGGMPALLPSFPRRGRGRLHQADTSSYLWTAVLRRPHRFSGRIEGRLAFIDSPARESGKAMRQNLAGSVG